MPRFVRSMLFPAVVVVFAATFASSAGRADRALLWCRAGPGRATVGSVGFTGESQAAMDKMMAAVEAPASGDPDHDFAALMIAHHQGAIDMAKAELRCGTNEVLRRLAQGIIVEQGQEIAAMRVATLDAAPR